MLHKRKVPLIEQNHENECGLAVVTMILKYFNQPLTLLDLEDRYGVPRGGTTFANLRSIFDDYDIKSKGIRVNDVRSLESISTPVICHWNHDHYVVLEQITGDNCLILDPAVGKLKLSISEFEKSFTGMAIIFESFQIKPRISWRKKVSVTFAEVVKKMAPTLGAILGLTVIVQILNLSLIFIQRWLIDNFSNHAIDGSMVAFASLIVISMIIYYLVQRSRVLLLTKFQLAFERQSLYKFMERMVSFPLKFFSVHGSGDLLFRVNSIAFIQQVFSQRILLAVVDLCFAIVYLIVMFIFSPILATIVLLLTLFIAAVSILYSIKNKDLVSRGMHREISAQEVLVEYFETVETFKSLGIENRIIDRWKIKFGEKQTYDKKKGLLAANLNTLYDALQFALPITLLCVGLYLSLSGSVSLGTAISFLSLASAFLSPVATLLESYSQLVMVKSYISKVSEVLDKKVEISEKSMISLRDPIHSLVLKDASYTYSSFDPLCVQDLNLDIQKGDKIAIVGPSGSGKSTVLKMLSGALQPKDGTIEINGHSITELSRDSLSDRLVYCSQKSALFNGTIFENISAGKIVDSEQLLHMTNVCEKLGLMEIIASSPMGIQTNISMGGKNISGGQLQRLVLARAIFSDADFLLLDEPTSALDNLSEAKIFEYIDSLSKTVVVVAHSLDTIKHFDKIVVMDSGRIIESGTHEELLCTEGLYSELYR